MNFRFFFSRFLILRGMLGWFRPMIYVLLILEVAKPGSLQVSWTQMTAFVLCPQGSPFLGVSTWSYWIGCGWEKTTLRPVWDENAEGGGGGLGWDHMELYVVTGFPWAWTTSPLQHGQSEWTITKLPVWCFVFLRVQLKSTSNDRP